MKKVLTVMAASMVFAGCTRIGSGEIGVRVDASKQIQGTELQQGSWNQTIIGEVLTFPIRDIVVAIDNKTPLTSDNSALADFDITVVYGINSKSVSELYMDKSKSFHTYDPATNDTLLMHNYITILVNNAAYKVVRGYKALEVADQRPKIEQQIREVVLEQLKAERLDTAITLNVVQIRNIAPNAEILKSSTAVVRAENELKVKDMEVQIAKKESERMAALAQNSAQSIAYMSAQSQMMIAQGIRDGKVQTIVVPMDFRGIVNVK